ncbi:MAG TPA: DUF305 domain-containing protein [Coriobacteriia bacterium]|nr:MAG: hypothetical protein XD74_0549 [Actinobacteria bacterium 66_15]HAL29801.1 DUF305 domain-containing protein [Coriobacteriia bacterium]
MGKKTAPVIATILILTGIAGVAATLVLLPPADPVAWPTRATTDAMFIEEMIPHHEDAIVMAELAIDHAEHPEVEQLARNIIETQSAEIAQMQQWYEEWFDADVRDLGGSSRMMGRGMMGAPVDLEDLENAEQFDKAFIEAMVPHHQMGVMMSGMASSNTNRSEMRDLTESIIDGQRAEIAQMLEWYEEWY